ncbi:FAS-associated factor 1 isoform X1 [Gorilla gorilla gorilla]|uniref:FAS-associated factor 1 isoform X1 n=1 Tax=Pan paniscus TaxID=9597 RepID=UPI001560545C|nr:FAS-associated factor 1 isoform X1 [Pan paniscus]XP_054522771.1 FAS-associated factor 1 isoform X1 [Pan troglodytes]XP_055204385.1 FAS-associated factor 1 isoform X1 [Gorilla gorilla gorilla]
MASNMDREMILADFQACTGIENIDEAITLLEQNNWDLVAAINGVIPQENGILQSEYGGETIPGPAFNPASHPASAPTSSSSSAFRPVMPSRQIVERQPRMLDFRVEYRDRNVDVVLEDSCTVGEIKQILENELQIPVSKMLLKGWKTGDVEDSTVLKSLHLPKNNSLYVLTPDLPPPSSSSHAGALQESLNQNFMLIITHREVQREYNLNFSGSSTIQEVKRNVYDLTSIPVRHQLWEGWPTSATDDSMCLAESGLSYPCHRLTVGRRSSPAQTREQSEEQITDVHMVSDSDGDDFEDATEFGVDDGEVFGMASSALRKSPMNVMWFVFCVYLFCFFVFVFSFVCFLVPENAENEGDALLQFTAEFSSRYGDCHPVFFIGSLEAAFQEAFYVKARDRKLLAIYLHHDESVLTNVFCSQMLCAESIVSYLSQNFITWAWDLTKDSNRARFLTMCNRHFGSVVAQTIRTQKTDQFPLFLIIMGKRSSNEVLNVIQGNTTVDELMMRLMAAMEIFTAQQQEDIKDEDEREARENVKREQDEAYRLSLEADRAKREAHEREMAEQFRLEQIRKEQEEEREAIRLSLEQALPPEPKEENAEPVSKLRIRTPSGEFLERRFLASNKLQIVFDFVASKGFPWDEYKLLSTFPRRDVTQLDPNKSLLEVKLFPQETLFLEAKE